MSASSYAACPRCTARAAARAQELLDAAADAYGKVGPSEYADMVSAASAAAVLPGNVETFREDYAVYGAETGTVTVSYGGSCEKCGLSLSFTSQHPIPEATS